jgi:hypothetical protein
MIYPSRQQPIIDDSDTDSDDGRAVIVAAKEVGTTVERRATSAN